VLDFNRNNQSDQPISIALNAIIDASIAREETRNYLGASAVGHECLRRIQFDWMCDPEHPARLRDIFDRGHYFEQRSREHLTRAGFKFAPDDRLQFTALEGMLSGHADGILISGPKIQNIAYPALWEHKAINAKGWRSLDRDGLAKAYPQYAAQCSLYQRLTPGNLYGGERRRLLTRPLIDSIQRRPCTRHDHARRDGHRRNPCRRAVATVHHQSRQLALPTVRPSRTMLAVMSKKYQKPSDEPKISKLTKMLSSSNDGEVVTAARALLRTLAQEGTDIHELADHVVGIVEGRKPSQAEVQRIYDEAFRSGQTAAAASAGFHHTEDPSFHKMACEIQHKANGRLSPKERDFVDDMVSWCARRAPSEKQAKWLHAIYCRIGRRR
jgi:hypothetical protein